MTRFLKLMAVFVLPAWMFDGCANRDPCFYLDDKSHLIAPWSTAPLTFDYRDRTNPKSERYQLDDISEFMMTDSIFTGKTAERYFIVNRSSGEKSFYSSVGERDAALERDFGTAVDDLREKPWYSGVRANVFYPYNLAYYFAAIVLIAVTGFIRRRAPKQMQAGG